MESSREGWDKEEFCDLKPSYENDERWCKDSSCLFTRWPKIVSSSTSVRYREGLIFISFLLLGREAVSGERKRSKVFLSDQRREVLRVSWQDYHHTVPQLLHLSQFPLHILNGNS